MRSKNRFWKMVACVALLSGHLAFTNAASAQALDGPAVEYFKKAEAAMAEKKYAEACKYYELSNAAMSAVGTQYKWAICLDKLGSWVESAARYAEVAESLATSEPGDAAKAREKATAMQAKTPRLTIVAPAGAQSTLTLQVQRDGAPIKVAAWGTPMLLNPGRYTILTAGADKQSWETTIDLAENQQVTLRVPVIPTEEKAPSPPPLPAHVAAPPSPTQRIAAVAVGVVGIAGIGVGAFFGGQALGKNEDSSLHCNEKNQCDPDGLALRDDALGASTLSTVAFAVGAAALAGGVVLYLTAPTASDEASPRATGLVVGPAAVSLQGSF